MLRMDVGEVGVLDDEAPMVTYRLSYSNVETAQKIWAHTEWR